MLNYVKTSQLEVAYYDHGSVSGWPCILNHGFPYDIHTYDECIEPLVQHGARVIVPYLRGFGPTKFLSPSTLRSGEQAALGNDLLELMNALKLENAVLAGYDWGGRAACIVAALWPERVIALVTESSYNIQDIARSMEPTTAEEEASLWYQYYFHSERGYKGLQKNRSEIAHLLWRMWSPTWVFDDATFNRTAPSFENSDFVDVVTHSYRHRYALVEGDPTVEIIETKLSQQPNISVPTISIDGENDGVSRDTTNHAVHFTGAHQHRVFSNTGHNVPQEQPYLWVQAILDVLEWAKN